MMNSVGGKLGGTLDTVNTTVANVNDIAVGLKQGRGVAGMLPHDGALAKQIRQTVSTSASSDLNSQQMPEKLGAVVDSVSGTANQAHQMISEIAQPDRQCV